MKPFNNEMLLNRIKTVRRPVRSCEKRNDELSSQVPYIREGDLENRVTNLLHEIGIPWRHRPVRASLPRPRMPCGILRDGTNPETSYNTPGAAATSSLARTTRMVATGVTRPCAMPDTSPGPAPVCSVAWTAATIRPSRTSRRSRCPAPLLRGLDR